MKPAAANQHPPACNSQVQNEFTHKSGKGDRFTNTVRFVGSSQLKYFEEQKLIILSLSLIMLCPKRKKGMAGW